MNWLDLIIAGLLIINAFNGFKDGLSKLSFSIIGLALATFLAINHVQSLALFLSQHLKSLPEFINLFLGFILIWLAVYYFIYFIGILINKALKKTPLGIFDSIIGSFLGILKAVLIIAIIMAIGLNQPLIEIREFIKDSLSFKWISPLISFGEAQIIKQIRNL